jgi:hypothetical protein
MPKKAKHSAAARGGQCCMPARARGGAIAHKRGLGGDILGGIGGKFFGGPGANIGRGVGDLIGGLFGLKRGGRVPGHLSAFH